LVEVPTDAVLRDAQAGLAAAVALIAQLCAVGIGLALGRRRVEKDPPQPPNAPDRGLDRPERPS
jgi:hypothetical protein